MPHKTETKRGILNEFVAHDSFLGKAKKDTNKVTPRLAIAICA
jgi:hypothetical protein